MAVFRPYPYPNIQQHRPFVLSVLPGAWHYTIQEEPFVARRRNITLSATSGEGYIGISQDGTSYSWYAGPLGADGRTLTAVASEAAAQAAPFALPSDGRVDLPAMADARFVKLGHRATAGSYFLREFYARRLVQTDDLEAESVTAIAIRAGTITADRISAAFTITGKNIQTAASGARVLLSGDTNGGLVGYSGSDTYDTVAGTGTYQILWSKADGKFYAGGGKIRIDSSGIQAVIASSAAYADEAGYKFNDGTNIFGRLQSQFVTGSYHWIELQAASVTGRDSELFLNANAPTGKASAVHIDTVVNLGSVASIDLFSSNASIVLTSDFTAISGGLNVGAATGATTGQVKAVISDAGTTTRVYPVRIGHSTSGTAGVAFGVGVDFQADSSTTALQSVGTIEGRWEIATHASRRSEIICITYDAASFRVPLTLGTNGSAPTLGFFGATRVVQQSIGAAAPAGGTGTAAGGWDTAAHRDAAITLLNNIRTALNNLGLTV